MPLITLRSWVRLGPVSGFLGRPAWAVAIEDKWILVLFITSFPCQWFRVTGSHSKSPFVTARRRRPSHSCLHEARAVSGRTKTRPRAPDAQPRMFSYQANTFWFFFLTTKKLICDFSPQGPHVLRDFSSTKQLHLSNNNLFIFPFFKLIKDIYNYQPESLISGR